LKYIHRTFLLAFLLVLVLLYNVDGRSITSHGIDVKLFNKENNYHRLPQEDPSTLHLLFESLEWDEESENDEEDKKTSNAAKTFLHPSSTLGIAICNEAIFNILKKRLSFSYCHSAYSLVIFFHRWKLDI
jgi:hypothetical protein